MFKATREQGWEIRTFLVEGVNSPESAAEVANKTYPYNTPFKSEEFREIGSVYQFVESTYPDH